jgi:antitoxin ParD1/3/4
MARLVPVRAANWQTCQLAATVNWQTLTVFAIGLNLKKPIRTGTVTMPTTTNVSLPDGMKAFVEEQVQTGGYGSVSEYVRELVRRHQKERAQARLEELLLEGLESGEPVPLDDKYRKGPFGISKRGASRRNARCSP